MSKAVEVELSEASDALHDGRGAYIVFNKGEPDETRYPLVALEWLPWSDGRPPEVAFRVECGPSDTER